MSWQQFVLQLGTLKPDFVEEIFHRHGVHSVTFTDAADNPVLEPGPGETPLWQDSQVTGLFDADIDIAALVADLKRDLGVEDLPPYRCEELEDRQWEREWLKDFGPMRFGDRLWICPSNHVVPDESATVVHLDPGLAFGTGTHPTTALCLEWLDGLPLHGKTLLDYGCGSGVLAIAGLKLGCRSAVAMDIDPQALLATRQNATNNGFGAEIQVFGRADEIQEQFDVVVANILAGPLVQFAESVTLTLCDEGILALSGILCEQADEVMNAYAPWIDFDEPAFMAQDGQTWSRLTGTRRTG